MATRGMAAACERYKRRHAVSRLRARDGGDAANAARRLRAGRNAAGERRAYEHFAAVAAFSLLRVAAHFSMMCARARVNATALATLALLVWFS